MMGAHLRSLVIVILLIISIPSRADEGLILLEKLIDTQYYSIYGYLKRKKVKDPAEYARLICDKIPNSDRRWLFAAKLVIESRGDNNAVSSAGALGPWQVMPMWCKTFKVKRSDLHNPSKNLDIALKVYNVHLSEAKGDVWGYKGAIWRFGGGSMSYVKLVRSQYEEAKV